MASASSYCFATIFRFTADVSMLASGSVVSPEIRLSDVNWKIELQKKTDETGIKNVLGVFLVSKFDKNTENFSIKAQAAFKLLRNDGQMEESIIKHFTKGKIQQHQTITRIRWLCRLGWFSWSFCERERSRFRNWNHSWAINSNVWAGHRVC